MNPLYLLDTNVLSRLASSRRPGHAEAHRRLAGLTGNVVLSPICLAEVEYGLASNHGLSADEVVAIRSYQHQFGVLDLGEGCAAPYGAIRAYLFEKFGRRDRRRARSVSQLEAPSPDVELQIQENDLWLASHAIARNAVLVTGDTKMHPIFNAARALSLQLEVEIWAVPVS